MVTREELKEKSVQEVQDLMQTDLENYKEEISSINEEAELLDIENALMKEHDEYQKVLKDVVYQLPESANFEGETIKKDEITKNIAYFLNKNEVEWPYTLGLYQLIKLWKTKGLKEISYDAYDSTLRLLNQLKYKGVTEWKDILVINEYMSSCHSEYVKDTSYLIYLSQKHNVILDRMKLVSPVQNAELTDNQA